tara:strand:- start:3 stop:599 length:597 start_codon:yes stop_codon:yes gene_type:complete
MKGEIFIILITLFIIANIYYDGHLIKYFNKYKKYYKMSIIAFFGLCFYLLLKKNPHSCKDMLYNANSYVKHIPMDRQTESFITPIIDFTSKTLGQTVNNNYPTSNIYNNNPQYNNMTPQQQRILKSGNKTTKRSVSETKKKFVAANQDWKCKHCNNQLSAWFEIDHVKKLEYGGSNNIDNLEALCRECHGKKTGMENL